ncbi:hypothetical protein E4U44_000612 [Claviceps purpurea]|nr:hypothetical protein E4U44_000612 [Claviceps purpurea]
MDEAEPKARNETLAKPQPLHGKATLAFVLSSSEAWPSLPWASGSKVSHDALQAIAAFALLVA